MSAPIQLVVGLGNPGTEYQYTRHNAGAWFTQLLAERCQVNLKQQTQLKAGIAEVEIDGQRFRIAQPTTFMNHSGEAVQAIARFYKIPTNAILIAHDELDFAAGTIRLKQNGGHGGHNGLRSLLRHLPTDDFLRLRIGIGHPGRKDLVHDYVLSRPAKSDFITIIEAMQQAISIIPDLLAGKVQQAIQALHTHD